MTEKLTVKLHTINDTMFIDARNLKDTIAIIKEVSVEKVIHQTDSSSPNEQI